MAAKRHKKRKIFPPVYLTLVLIILYLPILMVIIYSFNAGRTSGAWQGFSTQWYTRLFMNGLMADALRNSLLLAVLSSLLAGGVPMDVPNLRNREERDAWRNDNQCTNPAVAGEGELLPNCPEGNHEYPDSVYEEIRQLWLDGKPFEG